MLTRFKLQKTGFNCHCRRNDPWNPTPRSWGYRLYLGLRENRTAEQHPVSPTSQVYGEAGLKRSWVWFPKLIWWLTRIYNSSSRWSSTLFWWLWALHTDSKHTHIYDTHNFKNESLKWSHMYITKYYPTQQKSFVIVLTFRNLHIIILIKGSQEQNGPHPLS